MQNASRALVLGGGGLTGIAWETGLLLGLQRRGIDLTSADLFVGTSAGSVVAAQISTGVPLERLYQNQLDAVVTELPGRLGALDTLRLIFSRFDRDEQRALARVGKYALKAQTLDESVRRAVIEQRLPVHDWPARALKIPAIDALTGELRVFERSDGMSLVDAVGASCAVPMVWPCVTIESRRYYDGGIRSAANVDLAAGSATVVVLAPLTRSLRKGASPSEQFAHLSMAGVVVGADTIATATMGRNSLDPTARAASARAGLAQADRSADAIAAVWSK